MDNAQTIQRQLRHRILSGDLPPGTRLPSELELVRQLGVNRSQTRQALQQLEKEGLVVRRRGSGSFVADEFPTESGALAAATDTVKIVFPEYESRYVRNLIESFMERMFAAKKKVTNYHTRFDRSSELSFLHVADRMGVSGIVMWLTFNDERIRDALQTLVERHFPIVLADRCPEGVAVDFVTSDNRDMGRKLTQALVDQGHARIAFVFPRDDEASTIHERKAGYEEAMTAAGLPIVDEFYIPIDSIGRDAQSAVNEAMAHRERPTAFVCVNDYLASYVERELMRLGWRQEHNIALAYVDDLYKTADKVLPRVTVHQNAQEIGRACAELLLRRLVLPTAPIERRLIVSDEVENWGLGNSQKKEETAGH